KHFGFQPYTSDTFVEYWFPVVSTDGALMANQYGTLNVEKKGDQQTIYFNSLQPISEPISVYFGNELMEKSEVEMKPLELWTTTIANNEKDRPLKVVLGNNKLVYSEKKEGLDRPFESPEDFDWNSAYGLYLDGMNWVYQSIYSEAHKSFRECLEEDPYFIPALNEMAQLYYRKAEYEKALSFVRKALSVNTYDPKANFTYGLVQKQLGNLKDAEDGFSIASLTPSLRMAANIELAKLFIFQDKSGEAQAYAKKALLQDGFNHETNLLMALIERKTGTKAHAGQYLNRLSTINHYKRFEQWLLDNDESSKMQFTSLIRNELPNETYMEMACWYEGIGAIEEAIKLLETAPGNAMTDFKLAYLYHRIGMDRESNRYFRQAVQSSPEFVFPSRKTNIPMLKWTIERTGNWKPRYYLGVLQWALGNIDQAKGWFEQCEEDPEYYPFYAAKAELFKDENGYNREKDLLKTRKLGKNDWRTSRNLIDFYLENKREDRALEVARESIDLFHGHYEVNYALAKSLLANKQYTKCLDVLDKTQMLPSEGASRGRIIYRQAAVMESLRYYGKEKYNRAIQSIDKARKWPENLGVGQPYDADSRLEDFFEAECLMEKGREERAMELYDQVITYTKNKVEERTSGDFFYLLALKRKGNDRQTESFLDQWEQSGSDDPIFRWCEAMLADDIQKARKIEQQIATDAEGGTPWNPKNTDTEFELVKNIGYLLKSGQ
ncbi:MAG: tetratricopeptide repeat protein, partial [Bacteroidales bacterium]|nr:tetratricopeptide repeat protein [Bacteroidales bacterium]